MKYVKPITSLYEHIVSLAQNNPESIALIGCDEEGKAEQQINYEQLKEKIGQAGSWLIKLGLKEGDVLGLAMSNSVELLIVSWAAWSLGIITTPLDLKRDTLEQHQYKLEISKAKLLAAGKGIDKESFKVKVVEFEPEESGSVEWKKDISHQALILFTSGTTSKPKGAQLSLENLIANADCIKDWFKITGSDRFLVNLPLHHINSTSFCLATLLAEASIAIPPKYSNSKFWQQLAMTEATFTSIVPTICFDQLDREKEFEKFKDKLNLNRIQVGSAPVVVSDVKKFMQKFGIPLYQGYGQTETALRVTGVPLDLDKKTYEELVDSNCIGKAMKFAEIEIMGNDGKSLDEGEEGELVIKGPIVMKGYLGNIEAFRNDYFLTGDIGYYKMINDEKYYFLKGRSKEIIIKGGINISPVAVEDKVKQLNKNIQQVFVVGVPERRYGEEVAAVVCLKEGGTLTAIKNDIIHTKTLSEYEKPRYIVAMDADKIPLTSTGKVQRSVLKKMDLRYEPIYWLGSSKEHVFIILSSYQTYFVKQALDLYNYCWDPLVISMPLFRKHVDNGVVIAAVDRTDKVCGLITFLRTHLTEEQLSEVTYDDLTGKQTLETNDSEGKVIVCTSICSDNYKSEPVPEAGNAEIDKAKEYLEQDPVYKFHEKAKGGMKEGAKLIKLLPGARPEDKRAAGYNMLMKYPEIKDDVKVNFSGSSSVATQLIEAVMMFSQQLSIKDVYVFSRPIEMAKHFSK